MPCYTLVHSERVKMIFVASEGAPDDLPVLQNFAIEILGLDPDLEGIDYEFVNQKVWEASPYRLPE